MVKNAFPIVSCYVHHEIGGREGQSNMAVVWHHKQAKTCTADFFKAQCQEHPERNGYGHDVTGNKATVDTSNATHSSHSTMKCVTLISLEHGH